MDNFAKWFIGDSRSSLAFKVVLILLCFIAAGSINNV